MHAGTLVPLILCHRTGPAPASRPNSSAWILLPTNLGASRLPSEPGSHDIVRPVAHADADQQTSCRYIDWQHQSPAPISHSSDPYALGLTSPFKSDDSFTTLNDQWMTPASTARTGLVPSSAIMSPLQNAFTPSAQDASRDMSLKRQRNGSHVGYSHHHEGIRELQTPFADMATVQGPFVNNSFLERFDGTSLDESAFMPSNSTGSATSYHHMHTPPPTRDATSQRRLHKPTPLQTRAVGDQDMRRMSAPSAPMQHNIENSQPTYEHAAMPPGQTNMVQWQMPGPAPAPMGANSNMFWDPHRAATSSFTMYSSISEDPFAPEPWSNPIVYDQSPVPTLSASETFHPSVPVARLRAQSAARPRSAGPFSANNLVPRLRPMSFAAPANPSGVDPSLLMTGQGSMSHAIGNPFAASFPVDGRRPYQFQLEQMRKEKEDSARRAIRQPRPRPLATAFSSGLRRSMTDGRARRCNSPLRHPDFQPANVVSDSTDDLRNTHIPRDSSPLKRHRSDAHRPSLFSPHAQRQSVVLMVDEEGRARTEVRTLPASTDDDDDTVTLQHHKSLSPTRNLPLSRTQSLSQASETPFEASEDPSDARNALIADRQRRKKGGGLLSRYPGRTDMLTVCS